MSRFDDALRWKIFDRVVVPLAVALLTGAVIYGSTREKLDELTKANLPDRLTRVETQFADIDKKLDRVLDRLGE